MRVLLVDEQGVLRDGLHALLQGEPDIEPLGEAADGDYALRLAEELRPDVLVTEIDLPRLDGLDLIKSLRARLPEISIIVLTVYESDEMLWKALQAGASGYLPKRATGRELIQAIRSVGTGDLYIHPSMVKGLVTRPSADMALPDTPRHRVLSAREKDVLRLLAQGYTNREMARSLQISVRTVESHRASLMEKLDIHSRAELVQYASSIRLGPPLDLFDAQKK